LQISNKILHNKNIRWVNGTLGCYNSHYNLLNLYKNNTDLQFLIVLEDDCLISKTDLNECLNYLNKHQDIDILRINPWSNNVNVFPYKINTITSYSKFKDANIKYIDGGAHCCLYLIKNIPKILNFLNSEYVFHIDAVFSTNKINSVFYKINNNIKYNSKSSIQFHSVNLFKNNLLLRLIK
jgi:GR25 family glycosyltransferase involved in LPS biosynthesis